MKTVVVFFAAFMFILVTLQTNAQEVTVQQRKREKLPRHLLSEATPGPKVNNAGAGDTAAKNAPESKVLKTHSKADDDDGDKNPGYQGSGPDTDSPYDDNHHYWKIRPNDTESGPKVDSPGVGDTKGPAANNVAVRKDTNTHVQKDDNDDDRNPSFQNQVSAPVLPHDNHHYFSRGDTDP